MPRFDEGFAGLARLPGRAGGVGGGVTGSQGGVLSERDRAAAAMSAAIRRGDVKGVVVALRLLGVQPPGPRACPRPDRQRRLRSP